MEIKIYNKGLNVGKNDYIDFHNRILLCNNLKELRSIFVEFNEMNDIDKNTFFQGITINEGFVYTIENKINKKVYIGSTNNLVARMYSYQILQISNKKLLNDIIDLGISNFNIRIEKVDDYKEEEKNRIINSDNCYNIVHSVNKSNIKDKTKKGGYNIGKFYFKTKKELKNFCRTTIDKYKVGTIIDSNSDDYIFAIEMIKLHPKYDGFIDKCNQLTLSIIRDDQNDAKGIGQWNIFCFEYKINGRLNKWGFSTNKIISNI